MKSRTTMLGVVGATAGLAVWLARPAGVPARHHEDATLSSLIFATI